MKARIDRPLLGWEVHAQLPAIPREGEALTLNGIERTVRHVIWHVHEAEPQPWVQIVLQPAPDDREGQS